MSGYKRTSLQQKKDNRSSFSDQQKQMPGSHLAGIIQRARIAPHSLTRTDLILIQKTIGNRAVCQLMQEIGIMNTKPIQREIKPEEKEELLPGKFETMPKADATQVNEPAKLNHLNISNFGVIQRLIVLDQDIDGSRLQAAFNIFKKRPTQKITILPKANRYKLAPDEKLYLVAHGAVTDDKPTEKDKLYAQESEIYSLINEIQMQIFNIDDQIMDIEFKIMGIDEQTSEIEEQSSELEKPKSELEKSKAVLNVQKKALEKNTENLETMVKAINTQIAKWPRSFKHGDHNAKELAEILKKCDLKIGNVIKLISCQSGDGDDKSYTAELARELGEKFKIVGIKGLEATDDEGHTRGIDIKSVDMHAYDQSMGNHFMQEADEIAQKLYSDLEKCEITEDMKKIIPAAEKVEGLLAEYFKTTDNGARASKLLDDYEYIQPPKAEMLLVPSANDNQVLYKVRWAINFMNFTRIPTEPEIEHEFRTISVKFHPDITHDDGSNMQKLVDAKDILLSFVRGETSPADEGAKLLLTDK